MDVEHCVLAAAPSASFFQLLTSWGMRCHTAVRDGDDVESQLSQFLLRDDAQGDLFPPVLNLFTARLVEHMGSTPLSPRLAGVLQDLGRRKEQHKRVLPRALQWSADADPHFLLSHNLAMVQKHPKEHIIVALRDALNAINEQRTPCALSLMAALVVLQFEERKARICFAEVLPVAKDVARALEEHESRSSRPFRELLKEVAKKLEGASHRPRAPPEAAARESLKIYEFAFKFLNPDGIMDRELAAMKGLTAKLQKDIGGHRFSELHTHLTGMGGPEFWIDTVMKSYLPRRLATLSEGRRFEEYGQIAAFLRELTGLDEETIEGCWDAFACNGPELEAIRMIKQILKDIGKALDEYRGSAEGNKQEVKDNCSSKALDQFAEFAKHLKKCRGMRPNIRCGVGITIKQLKFRRGVDALFPPTSDDALVTNLLNYVKKLRAPARETIPQPFSVDPVVSVELLAQGLGLTCPRELCAALDREITRLEENVSQELDRFADETTKTPEFFFATVSCGQVLLERNKSLQKAKKARGDFKTRYLTGQIVRNLTTTDFDNFQTKFRHYTVFDQRKRKFRRVFGIRNVDLVAEIWPEAIHELEGIYGGIYYLPDPLPTHSVRPAVQQRVEALMKNCFAMLAVDGGRPQEADMLMYRSRFTPEFYPRRFALKDALYEQSLEVLTLHVATLARHLAEAGVRYTEISHSVNDIVSHPFEFIRAGAVFSLHGVKQMKEKFLGIFPADERSLHAELFGLLFGSGFDGPAPGVDIRFLAGFPRTRYDYTAFLTNHSRSPLEDLFQDPRCIMELAQFNAEHPLRPEDSPDMLARFVESVCRAFYHSVCESMQEGLRPVVWKLFYRTKEKIKETIQKVTKVGEFRSLCSPFTTDGSAASHEALRTNLKDSLNLKIEELLSKQSFRELLALFGKRLRSFFSTFYREAFPKAYRMCREFRSDAFSMEKFELIREHIHSLTSDCLTFIKAHIVEMVLGNAETRTFWVEKIISILNPAIEKAIPNPRPAPDESLAAFAERCGGSFPSTRGLFRFLRDKMEEIIPHPREYENGFAGIKKKLNKDQPQYILGNLFYPAVFENFSERISDILSNIGAPPEDLIAEQLGKLGERVRCDPELVVGLDWMSDEVYNPFCALVHPRLIAFAQRHGLGIRIHDGELAPSGPELEGGRDLAEFAHMYVAAKSIVHTFRELDKDCRGASWRVRIGHGIAFANWTWDGGQAQTFLRKLSGFKSCEIHRFAGSEQMFLEKKSELFFRWGRFTTVCKPPGNDLALFQITRIKKTQEFRVLKPKSTPPGQGPLAALEAQSKRGVLIKYGKNYFKFARRQDTKGDNMFYARRLLELVNNVEVIRRHICLEVNLTSNFFLVPNFAGNEPPDKISQHALRRLLYLDFRCTLSTDNDGIWEIVHGGHVGVAAEYALAIENRMIRTEAELEALRGAADECRFWPLGYEPAVWEKLRVWELGEPEEFEGFTIRSSRTELLGLPGAPMRIWSCALSSDGFLCAMLEGDPSRLVICDQVRKKRISFRVPGLRWACVYNERLFFGLEDGTSLNLHRIEFIALKPFFGLDLCQDEELPRENEPIFGTLPAGSQVCLDLARHGWLVGRAGGEAFALSLTPPHETLDKFPPVLTERRHRLLWERLWAITTMCFPTDITEPVPSGLAPHAEYAPWHIEMLINALLNGRARLGETSVLTDTLSMDLDPPLDVDVRDSCWILVDGALFLGSRDGRNWRLFDVRPKK
eukprot:gnl/Chilomastix_cuspidata/151.p1 GENE.gnl/Chilomastix_cuspidata/151~~gnl/Chilomastix_cuspidata/151.p1  ORF type:complete len:1820 (+),score=463.04 gnl/Chilomastix_cuspidata/151:256-5460(+)